MEGRFFFGEYERWNLGWDNPNPAGLFIAMLIVILWPAQHLCRSHRAVVCGLFLSEMVLWFLLCKTYSRGAMVAVCAVGILRFVVCFRTASWKNVRYCVSRLLRIIVITALIFGTGFFARIDPKFVRNDESSGNRLTLWQGGLQMMADSPWQGWGDGKSGLAYMNYYQDMNADEEKKAYRGMVNGFLTIGVERGFPVLFTIFFVSAAFILLGGVHSRKGGAMQIVMFGASCVVMVFLCGNVFSTLYIFHNLLWLPSVAVVFLFLSAVKYRADMPLVKMICASLLLSAIGCLTLFLMGKISDRACIVSHSHGMVSLSKPVSTEKSIVLLGDSEVLGTYWGKEARRLLVGITNDATSVICAQSTDEALTLSSGKLLIVICGSRCDEYDKWISKNPSAHVVFLHPSKKSAIASAPKNATVLMPMLDVKRMSSYWRKLTQQRGWEYRMNRGVGQDIRRMWPDCVVGIFW